MTLLDFMRALSQVSFLLVCVVTIISWAKHRDQTRFDVAMIFTSFAFAIVGQYVQGLFHDRNPWLGLVFVVAILVQPTLLLRIARYFHPLPRWVLPATVVSLVMVGAVVAMQIPGIVPGQPAGPAVFLPLIAHLVVTGGYAGVVFIRGALTIPGITGKRLLRVSIASGFLVLDFLVALIPSFLQNSLTEPFKSIVGAVSQLLAIASAVFYYLGFAPPRGLIRSWQLMELQLFLRQTSKKPSTALLARLLADSTVRAVGGADALVGLLEKGSEGATMLSSADESLQRWDLTQEPAVARVIQNQRPAGFPVSDDVAGSQTGAWVKNLAARHLYVVPLSSSSHTLGFLLVALRNTPLFGHDELELLALFAEQIALQMTNTELLEQLEDSNRSLLAANKELEAFSYSVSHDLRSPLRGIDGWTSALQEDYGQNLDDTAREYMTRVRNEAHRMGELIDDLFQLSRVSTSSLTLELIDLAPMASQVMERLQLANPARRIEFVVQPSLMAWCDHRLMEVGLTNLLDNAVKFTEPRPVARIELGKISRGEKVVYFVKDNGVGYDVNFAQKLFGVFQRMHPVSAFPGTGIGLAIVKRVIERQGGEVWSEGQVDKGACFFFTLKEPS